MLSRRRTGARTSAGGHPHAPTKERKKERAGGQRPYQKGASGCKGVVDKGETTTARASLLGRRALGARSRAGASRGSLSPAEEEEEEQEEENDRTGVFPKEGRKETKKERERRISGGKGDSDHFMNWVLEPSRTTASHASALGAPQARKAHKESAGCLSWAWPSEEKERRKERRRRGHENASCLPCGSFTGLELGW